jgi:hypothetical protein
MSRSPLRFKQTDVARALRAVVAAGVEVREMTVDANGAIRVITGKVEAPPIATQHSESGTLAVSSLRQADYMWSFMSAVFSLAVDDGELVVSILAPAVAGSMMGRVLIRSGRRNRST